MASQKGRLLPSTQYATLSNVLTQLPAKLLYVHLENVENKHNLFNYRVLVLCEGTSADRNTEPRNHHRRGDFDDQNQKNSGIFGNTVCSAAAAKQSVCASRDRTFTLLGWGEERHQVRTGLFTKQKRLQPTGFALLEFDRYEVRRRSLHSGRRLFVLERICTFW